MVVTKKTFLLSDNSFDDENFDNSGKSDNADDKEGIKLSPIRGSRFTVNAIMLIISFLNIVKEDLFIITITIIITTIGNVIVISISMGIFDIMTML